MRQRADMIMSMITEMTVRADVTIMITIMTMTTTITSIITIMTMTMITSITTIMEMSAHVDVMTMIITIIMQMQGTEPQGTARLRARGRQLDERPEELPFDLSADVIEITDADYAIWYMDCMDNPKNMRAKSIFPGIGIQSEKLKKECLCREFCDDMLHRGCDIYRI